MSDTEEEARKKVCQESFGVVEVRDVDGSGIREGGPWRCIASECMAWRWNSPQRAILKDAMIHTPQYSITLADAIKNGGEYTVVPNSGNGYCGKAGRS